MKYCKRCCYPANHPLFLTFDAEGVCSGCRVHEEKDELDWNLRTQMLENLLSYYRGKGSARHDCIVPVTGARDSYFIVHTVKRVFGMNPLLVSYNRHYNTERGIRNLAYLRGIFDCDFMQLVIQPDRVKRITRETLRLRASMHWHALAGQSVWPVQVAVRLKIPLIIWGAHQGIDQVGMFSHLDEVEMTRKYRSEHDLMCLEAEDLIGREENLSERDVSFLQYPNDKEIARVGVRGVYLNNYIRWDSKAQHEEMIKQYGYETAEQQRTFDSYNDVDCQHYSGIHDWIKFQKFGYGKVTDHVCREIRLRRLTREQGISLISDYSSRIPRDRSMLLSWLEITEDEFDRFIERFRSSEAWCYDSSRGWVLRDPIVNHADDLGVDKVGLPPLDASCQFEITPSRDPSADEFHYILMARGHVDSVPVPQVPHPHGYG